MRPALKLPLTLFAMTTDGADGAGIYARLWSHFLAHRPLSRWLLHEEDAPPTPADVTLSVAFVCEFPVPPRFSSLVSTFAYGELLIPQRVYDGRFIMGSLLAATDIHKYVACLGPPNANKDALLVRERRVVVDCGERPFDPVRVIDFAWMRNGSLVVTTKQLAPIGSSHTTTGAVAIYHHASRGALPDCPSFLVSYVEPRACARCGTTCTCSPATPPEHAWHQAVVSSGRTHTRTHQFTSPTDSLPLLRAIAERAASVFLQTPIKITTRVATGEHLVPTRPIHSPPCTFRIATQAQMVALQQVAVLAASFAHPANSVSTRLIHDIPLPTDALKTRTPEPDILTALEDATRETNSESGSPKSASVKTSDCTASEIDATQLNVDQVVLTLPAAFSPRPSATSVDRVETLTEDFVYSPVSVSAQNPNALAAAIAATDRALYDRFFPAPTIPTAFALSDYNPSAMQRPAVDETRSFLSFGTPPAVEAVTPPLQSAPELALPRQERTSDSIRQKRERVACSARSTGVCDACGKCFFKSGALARHMRSAHPTLTAPLTTTTAPAAPERLDCPRCPKTFSQQGSLNRHLRSIHESRKLHCSYCTLAFGQAFDLKRHQKRKHPGFETVVPREALPAFVVRGRACRQLPQRG